MAGGICRVAGVLLALCLSAVLCNAQEQEAGPPTTPTQSVEPTMALWKERDLQFTYRSPVATHTCQELSYRVAAVLVAVGARPDVQVQADGCEVVLDPQQSSHDERVRDVQEPWRRSSSDRFGIDNAGFANDLRRGQSTRVRIHMASPIEVSPAEQEEWRKAKSRHELVARVTGNAASLQQLTGEFPAEWQPVTLSRRTMDLAPEDCALLEQMSTSVLRQLRVRKIHLNAICSTRGEPSRLPPQLTAEALMSNPYGRAPAATPESQEASPSSAPSDPQPPQPTPMTSG